jgi:branched-subunit amino acid transport protein
MTAFVALLAVAVVSWLYRISFTAVLAEDRLPTGLRARMDAVGPAAFAALLATHVAGTDPAELPAVLAGIAAAAVASRLTPNHLVAVLAAAAAWALVALV